STVCRSSLSLLQAWQCITFPSQDHRDSPFHSTVTTRHRPVRTTTSSIPSPSRSWPPASRHFVSFSQVADVAVLSAEQMSRRALPSVARRVCSPRTAEHAPQGPLPGAPPLASSVLIP